MIFGLVFSDGTLFCDCRLLANRVESPLSVCHQFYPPALCKCERVCPCVCACIRAYASVLRRLMESIQCAASSRRPVFTPGRKRKPMKQNKTSFLQKNSFLSATINLQRPPGRGTETLWQRTHFMDLQRPEHEVRAASCLCASSHFHGNCERRCDIPLSVIAASEASTAFGCRRRCGCVLERMARDVTQGRLGSFTMTRWCW